MEHFSVGTIDISPGAHAALAATGVAPEALLQRHQQGDWGEAADDADRGFSEWGLQYGHQIMSIYQLADGAEIMVTTSPDRSLTRLLLGTEYEVREVDIREGYALWSSAYDHEKNPLIAIEEPQVERLLAGIPATRVLDVGTGTGRHALRFARRGAAVTAIDQSPEMLALAQAAARREGLSIAFHQGMIEDGLPFAAGSFDFVVCALMLSHGPDLSPCMAEFARVLSPHGHLLITDFHPEVVGEGWRSLCTRPGVTYLLPNGHATRADILTAVEGAGLTLRTVIDVPLREVPPESFPELMRRAHGDKSFCLILLAQKMPHEAVENGQMEEP